MTLSGKKSGSKSSSKKFKPRQLIYTDKGIKYLPTGEIWEYPIFIGTTKIYSLGSKPLSVEFKKSGKFFYFVFYDSRLGMVAKSRVHGRYVNYIIQEIVSRKGKIPKTD